MAKIKRINSVTIKKVGDWKGATKFLSSMGYEVKAKTLQAQYEICKKLKGIVVKHILDQDLNWEPLAPTTIKNKNKNKNQILIDTEVYINNIKVWKEAGVAKAGVKKGVMYRRANGAIALDRVAALLETGTTKMPARPLWEPSINELGGKEGIRQFVVDAIYRRLKWLSRGTPIKVTKKQILKKVSNI